MNTNKSRWNVQSRVGIIAALSFAVAAASAGSALAQKPRYTRDTTVKVDVKISERSKPKASQGKAEEAAPALSADQVLNIEGLVGDIREEQRVYIEELIKDTPDSEVDEKADLYFRLAEHHAKQQRFFRLRTQEFAIKADASKKPADKSKFKAESDKAAKSAKASLIEAIKVYKKLTENEAFRNFNLMDQALFYFGYTLQSAKYLDDARNAFDRLLKNYPDSKYVPEAHLAFADYHFENNQLADAESRYKRVLQFPKSNVYWYAMYKLGWVKLNQNAHQDALELFYEVAMKTKSDKKLATLNRASKKDIVRAYAEVGNVSKAYPYFQKVDKDYSFDMYVMLGGFYLDQGKNDKAVAVYRDLIEKFATNKNVCLWQYNIALAMMSSGTNPQKVEEIENLVNLYGKLKGTKTLPANEMSECHDNAAAMAGEYARAWHSESAKTQDPTTLAYADKLYNVYLKVFPDADDFPSTQYYYAELLWMRAEKTKEPRLQTELWENAAIAFTDVVKLGKVDEKMKKESAKAAVLAWKNALNVDPRVKAIAPEEGEAFDKVPEAKPIPEREQKMIDAFDIYITYINDPKDDELVGMKFLKANMYRRYNHFDKALPIFEEILVKHQEHETALYSANALLDTLNRLQRYDEMMKWVDKLLKNPEFLKDKDELVATLNSLKATALRKGAEKIEKDAEASGDIGKYIECGKMYTEIYNREPEGEGADEVIFNAAVCFEKGKSVGQAITMYKKIEGLQAASKSIKAMSVARLGVAYQNIAFFGEAAKYQELYYAQYAGQKATKDLPSAKEALGDAVFFRKGIGDDAKAEENTRKFVANRDATKSEKAEAFFSLFAIYEKQGDTERLIKHLREYVSKYGNDGGAAKRVMAFAKIGQALWSQSCPVKSVHGSCITEERERATRGGKRKAKRVETQTRCGPESKVKIVVKNRDDKKVKDAKKAFEQAIAEYAKLGANADAGNADAEAAQAQYFFALAKFYIAEVDFEAYLALKFPEGLNFDPANEAVAKKSGQRLEEWLKKKAEVGGNARSKFEAVIGAKDPANAIAAAARLGQIAQNLSDALFTAEIPANIRKYEEAAEAYCDALLEKAEPLESRSIEAFSTCLGKSTEYGYFSDWSKLCEYELGQIKPEDFPTARELRDDPENRSVITDVEPASLKLE